MTLTQTKGAATPPALASLDELEQDLDQYLTLGLSGETFAVPVQQVREVLDLQKISRLANAPAMLLGMIDVRGTAIPVVDLKQQLGLDHTLTTEHSRIVVLDLGSTDQELLIGAVTDAVYEVADIGPADISPPPTINRRWDSSAIKGIARRRDQFVTVLDLGHVFSASGLDLEGLNVG
jgi:purine-binding chemotaxis protein CheW